MPAPMDACRAGFCPCAAVRICPMSTSDTSAPATPARLSASTIATLPRSWAGRLPNAPANAPTGVRAAPTMTISFFMFWAPLIGPGLSGQDQLDQVIRPSGTGHICGSFGFPATPDVHAIWHLAYPWPAGGWHVNETEGQADLQQWRQDVTTAWDDTMGTTAWDQH